MLRGQADAAVKGYGPHVPLSPNRRGRVWPPCSHASSEGAHAQPLDQASWATTAPGGHVRPARRPSPSRAAKAVAKRSGHVGAMHRSSPSMHSKNVGMDHPYDGTKRLPMYMPCTPGPAAVGGCSGWRCVRGPRGEPHTSMMKLARSKIVLSIHSRRRACTAHQTGRQQAGAR